LNRERLAFHPNNAVIRLLVGDIAPIAVFLASDDSGWLTGEQLLATGGIR
jgi:NAD(P)-dependent dehydrogenase (short-subunit alcohol dehydrogenase family)